MKMEILSIYYDDNTNSFEDENGWFVDIIPNDVVPIEEMARNKRLGGSYYYKVDEEITYEIVFPIRESNRTLYYDAEENIIYDEEDDIVFNIFSIVSPNDLYIFKKGGETIEVCGVLGGLVELIWPDLEE